MHMVIMVFQDVMLCNSVVGRLRLKCDGTCAETRFSLSAKRKSPFQSAGVLVQSTTGSQGVCNSNRNAGYTMIRGSVKGTGYLLHSPVSPSIPLLCVTVCHHVSTGLYQHCTGICCQCPPGTDSRYISALHPDNHNL